jgi:hypothetical protein
VTVSEKIKEMAHKEAFKYYFCNVGDDDWPDDPDAFMDKVDSQDEAYECEAIELSYEDEDGTGKCMDIWAPFAHHSIGDVQMLMEDFETALINFYEEAKKLDKE